MLARQLPPRCLCFSMACLAVMLHPQASGWSRVFHFRSQDTPETIEASLPQVHLLYGDLGSKCAFSLSPACSCSMVSSCSMANTSAGAMMEVLTPVGNPVTMVLHVGDFA